MSQHSVPKQGRIDSFYLPSKRVSSSSSNVDNSVPIEVVSDARRVHSEHINTEGVQNVEDNEANVARVEQQETDPFQRMEHGDTGVQRINLQQPGSDKVDVFNLQRDPGLRTPILEYPLHYRDDVRRAYLNMGAYHPKLRYPKTWDGCSQNRGFNYKHFKKFPWLGVFTYKGCCLLFPVLSF